MVLSDGDEYLDLGQLDRGVCLAAGISAPMGCVVSKRAVREATWSKILSQLAAYRTATLHFGVGHGRCT